MKFCFTEQQRKTAKRLGFDSDRIIFAMETRIVVACIRMIFFLKGNCEVQNISSPVIRDVSAIIVLCFH